MAPSDTTDAKYYFGNRFKVIVNEVDTDVVSPTEGDSWFIAIGQDEGGYSFGIVRGTDNTTLKGYLGSNVSPKLAGLASLLLCCQQASTTAETTLPLIINLDRCSTIKAVMGHKVRSKLAIDCISCMNELAETREVKLNWTSAESASVGAKTAKQLANEALREGNMFIGPCPVIPNVDFKSIREDWLGNKAVSSWLSSPTGDHARRFLPVPSHKLTKKLMSLKKIDTRLIVGIITGHTTLVNAYKHRIGLRDDPLCDRCNMGEETAEHFICWCPAWETARKEAFGKSPIQPQEVLEQDINGICSFLRRTGRMAVPAQCNPFSGPSADCDCTSS